MAFSQQKVCLVSNIKCSLVLNIGTFVIWIQSLKTDSHAGKGAIARANLPHNVASCNRSKPQKVGTLALFNQLEYK